MLGSRILYLLLPYLKDVRHAETLYLQTFNIRNGRHVKQFYMLSYLFMFCDLLVQTLCV